MKSDNLLRLLREEDLLQENEDIIVYGLYRLKVTVSTVLLSLTLGVIMGIIGESIIFLLVLIPLRRYAGGYHADNKETCFIISILLLINSFWVIKNIHLSVQSILLLTGCSFFITFVLAPVGNSNKKLDDAEIKIYRCRARVIMILECIALILSLTLDTCTITNSILAAIANAGLLLLAGFVKNKYFGKGYMLNE